MPRIVRGPAVATCLIDKAPAVALR
jgi:hypothetical protein